MKRIALLVLSGVLALSLSACGDNAEKKDESKAANAEVKMDDKGNTETPDATVVKTPETNAEKNQ